MASIKLNNFTCTGYVSDKPVLHPKESEGSVVKVSFHLRNPKLVGGKQYYNEFYVVTYGKTAKSCYEHLSEGSECTVIGSVNTWNKIDPETNEKTFGMTVDAKEVLFN